MSLNNSWSCLPSAAQIHMNSSANLNENLQNSGAPGLTIAFNAQMFEYNDPHSRFERASYDVAFHDFYAATPPLTAITQTSNPQLPVDAGYDVDTTLVVSRERIQEERLNPVLVGSTSMVKKRASRKRKAVPARGVTNKVIEKKVDLACTCCRVFKQKCDGEKPTCGRCTTRGRRCQYIPGQQALKRATGLPIPEIPEVPERSKPAKRAARRPSRSKAPLRTLKPRPRALAAAVVEELVADPQAVPLAAESDGEFAGPPGPEDGLMCNLKDFDWEVEGLAPVAAGGTSYGEYQTGVGGLNAVNDEEMPPFQQADPAYGGDIPQLHNPSPFYGVPGIPAPEPRLSPAWNPSPAQRLSLEAPTNWAERPLGNIGNLGMGFTFNQSYQPDPVYRLQSFHPFPNQGF